MTEPHTDPAREGLRDAIQSALDDEWQHRPDLYEPSPGQYYSHVGHRIARLVADALLASEQFTIGLRTHEEHEMEPLRGAPDTGERSERTGLVTRPGLLAVDADGYIWRCYDDELNGIMWSMAPTNPDNSPIPQPVTYYEPVG